VVVSGVGVVAGGVPPLSGLEVVVCAFLSTTELEVVEAVALFDVVVLLPVGVVVGVVFCGTGVIGGASDIIFSGHFLIYHGFAPVGVLIMFGTVLIIGVFVFFVVVNGDFKSFGFVGIPATDHVPTDALFFTGFTDCGLKPQKEAPKVPLEPPPPKLPPQKFTIMYIITN
jgi:hypothetical protein